MSNKNNNIYPVGAIKHDDEHRASIPTTELAGEESMVVESMTPEGRYAQFKHEFDRGRDPELYWLDKYKNDDEEIERLGGLHIVKVTVRWGDDRRGNHEEESYVTFWRKPEE